MVAHVRLARYGVAGGFSLLVHATVLLVLVEVVLMSPVYATIIGFGCSLAVSYYLQYVWVFCSNASFTHAFPRFLLVCAIGLLLNASIMALGTSVLGLHYAFAQAVAFIVVPISNYLINRSWTFAPGDTFQQNSLLGIALPFVMTGFWVSLALLGAIHLDLARDVMVGSDITRGVELPLQGPPLAGVFHLGPIWYYGLAFLQLLGGYGTIVAILASLSALQFWLAQQAGRLIQCPTSGLVWSALLFVPAWGTFELILMSHPVLVSVLTVSMILLGAKYLESGCARFLAGMLMCFSLGVHAHPTMMLQWVFPAGVLILGLWRHRTSLIVISMCATAALIPFIPWVFHQHLSEWVFFQELARYSSEQQSAGSLSAFWPLLWQMTGGGVEYWLRGTLGWPAVPSMLIALFYTGIVLVGLCGGVVLSIRGNVMLQLMFLTVLVGAVSLSLVRTMHAYYMLSGVHTILLGIAAFGIAYWASRIRSSRRILNGIVVGAISMSSTVYLLYAIDAREGGWPFAFMPLFNVTSAMDPHARHPFLTPMAASASGRWLCRNRDVVVHGSYALSILHTYASESQLRCGIAHVPVHGLMERSARHVVGVSKALLRRVNVEPVEMVGVFGVLPASRIAMREPALIVGKERPYPVLEPRFGEVYETVIDWVPRSDELVIVSDLSFGLATPPTVTMRCGDDQLDPLVEDRVTWIFDASVCESTAEVILETSAPEYMNVVGINR
ncbi:GtrA family protein [Wenzhouxiangella sp. AB-CW3]|uniref:GtrA family protein n=1 Tax=Wenzhouxiangella sp. AB-CW3 TaxID=2771012 RepID=UPI001CC28302|nr:GtrA family protein [Wenzhouxiangella sp. AB-CW3]